MRVSASINLISNRQHLFFVSVYTQTFCHQMKTPIVRSRKVHLLMDIYCYEPVHFAVSLKHIWTTVCVSVVLLYCVVCMVT